jgi:lactate permease
MSIIGWQMPVGQSIAATTQGIFFGTCQIMFLLLAALWLYNTSVRLGWDLVLQDLMHSISPDLRVLSILIAFCFGALIEGLAGFGTPVAITAAMMAATGMPKLKAAAVCMLANTAPVAFGSIGAPITALGNAAAALFDDGTHAPTDLANLFGQMAGRQSPFMALLVPFFLLAMVDGKRGLKDCWHIALIAGASFGIAQYTASNHISYMVTDLISALFSLLVLIVALRYIKPKNPMLAQEVSRDAHADKPALQATGAARVWGALTPYVVIIVIFAISQIPAIKAWLTANVTVVFNWPGLANCQNATGGSCINTSTNLYSVLSTGTFLAIGALITAAIYRLHIKESFKVLGHTIYTMRFTIITIASVLGIAYILNASGMTISLGRAIASVGVAFAFLSPVLGWIGVAITGSDTSSNALFGGMQVAAAQSVPGWGVEHQVLAATTNSTGGVMGKMISPQSLSVAAAASGMLNQEGTIFRKVLPWSIALLVIFCALVGLQAFVLTAMIPLP